MTVYPQFSTAQTHAQFPWWEALCQHWPTATGAPLPGYQRPDLSLADRLLIAALVNLPSEQRPWGLMTRLAEVFATSRPTIYAIGERGRTGLQALPSHPVRPAEAPPAPPAGPGVTVTPQRVCRTILALLVPGQVSGRNIAVCLQAALDESRSNATVSHLLHEAGQRAGEILAQVDYRPLGPQVLARDELYVGRQPILVLVEPHSLAITGLYAVADREAETWACALLLTQDRVQIHGLAEDGCVPYAASCRAAALDAAIQRDVWHPLHDTTRVVRDVQREVRRLQQACHQLEKQLTTARWQESGFADWVQLVERQEALQAQVTALQFWHECLQDAMELVDLRSGEIRDHATNAWLLDETLAGLRQLAHPRIQALADKLTAQAPELLTFLATVAAPLAAWQARVQAHYADARTAAAFQATVARLWRLTHALRAGQRRYATRLATAQQQVAHWVAQDPVAQTLAEALLTLLEQVVRTSSAAETINSVLRPFLDSRREATDLTSRQLFLNLFQLWFNLHRFARGPRAGQSPYALAGIDLGSDDWLTVLGYPPD